jgi:probable addiction module antidote protein
MTTVFIGGSRQISRLPAQVKERLRNIVDKGHQVAVGDASGADKAVQKFFLEAAYDKVTVFCSGDKVRNNLRPWSTRPVAPGKSAKGFQFYAAKDREMARLADFGLMIWDGKSPGTALNVLRLLGAGKKAVLLDVPAGSATTFKTLEDWDSFLGRCSDDLRQDLYERATPEEWRPMAAPLQASLPASPAEARPNDGSEVEFEDRRLLAEINVAFSSGDPAAVLEVLGKLAKSRGMSQVAKEAGLARESLYRSLGSDGNPEFATVFKVLMAVGLRLTASQALKRRA